MSESQFAMVSDWMVNGNITDFVKAHPDANRINLVSYPLKALSSLQAHVGSSSWETSLEG